MDFIGGALLTAFSFVFLISIVVVIHELGLLTHGILESRKAERRRALAFLDRVLA